MQSLLIFGLGSLTMHLCIYALILIFGHFKQLQEHFVKFYITWIFYTISKYLKSIV